MRQRLGGLGFWYFDRLGGLGNLLEAWILGGFYWAGFALIFLMVDFLLLLLLFELGAR